MFSCQPAGRARVLLLAALAPLGLTAPLAAQTWDSGGVDSNWTTGANWDTNVAPANNGTANLLFGSGAKTAPFANAPFDINSLTFHIGAPSFSIGGNTLSIRGGGITVASSNSQAITNPLSLLSAQTWNASSGILTTFGPVNLNANALTVTGNFNTVIAGAIFGSGSLVKNGSGTLTLGNGPGDFSTNTFSGPSTINAGTLSLNKASGTFAISGDLTLAGSGSLAAARDNLLGPNVNVTLNGSGTFNPGNASFRSLSVFSSSGLVGAYSLSHSLTIGGGLTVVNPITFSGGFGTGFITLANNNTSPSTLSGSVNLNGEFRRVTVPDNTASPADDLTISGVISNGYLDKFGPGTLALTGNNSHFQTYISEGTVRVASGSALGASNAVLMLDGGTLQASGTFTATQFVNLFARGGTIDVPNAASTATFSGNFWDSGPLTKTGPGKLVIGGGPSDGVNTLHTGSLTVNAGTVTFSKGDNILAAPPRLIANGGTIELVGPGHLSTSADVTVQNGGLVHFASNTTMGSFTALGSGFITLNGGPLTFTGTAPSTFTVGIQGIDFPVPLNFTGASGGGIANNASSAYTLSGALNFGGRARAFNVENAPAPDDITVTGPISNGSLVKNGFGTLYLTNPSNSFNGLNITNGTLRVAADGPLGAPGAPVTLGLFGTLRTSASFTSARNIQTEGGAFTPDANTELTLTGTISGLGWIGKTGPGTLTLAGPNTHTGGARLVAGTIAIGDDNSLGAGDVTFAGGALRSTASPRTLANRLNFEADATFPVGASLTFNGPAFFHAGNHNLTVLNATTLSGPLSRFGGVASFTKLGFGTLTLSGPSTIGGPITVNEGVLSLPAGGSHDGDLVNSATFQPSGGALAGKLVNHATTTVSNTFAPAGGVQNFGTLNLPLTDTLTSGGPGVVNDGNLALSGGTLDGHAPVVNNARITGHGTITGPGINNFVNNAQVTVSNGNLTLSKGLATVNNGSIDLATGLQLRLGQDLANNGALNLNGGAVVSAAAGAEIANNFGGVITGRGSILVPFASNQNNGVIAIPQGMLNVTSAFDNFGAIHLTDPTASLAGGDVTNRGTIQGHGALSSRLANQTGGTVEAIGGTLTLGAAGNSNAAGATLAASTGNKLLLLRAINNGGLIALTGGTFQSAGTLINNGQISGFGTLRADSITNNSILSTSFGTADLNGPITNAKGGKIIVTGNSSALFRDPLTLERETELRVSAGSTAVFLGPVEAHEEALITGGGTKHFEAGGSNLGPLSTTGSTIVAEPAAITASHIREASLEISGQASINPNGTPLGTSRLGNLTIRDGGSFDLANNDLIIDGGDLTRVTGYLADGKLNSSAATAITTLGVILNGTRYTSFSGQGVSPDDVLVKYTYFGDVNLDEKVNILDYLVVDRASARGQGGWIGGDVNYSGGPADGADYFLIDQAFLAQGAPLGLAAGGVVAVSVPEPVSVVLAVPLLLRRRRGGRV